MKQRQIGSKWFQLVDWTLVITTLLISVIGITIIHSATFASESSYFRDLYIRQMEWSAYGILLMAALSYMDYRSLERPAYLLYLVFLVLLVLVLYKGKVISGSQRWIGFGGFNIQPSELVKVVVILVIARYFDGRVAEGNLGFKQLFVPFVIMLIPAALVYRQPDMGTAVIIGFIFSVMAFVNGIRRRVLAIIVTTAIVAIPISWFNLKPYQKNRIMAMLDPSSDPLGIGYHTIQSKIAIGSGGFFGKGLFGGTQSKLNFLPEKHTDFIFSVYAEELGFLGVAILLFLYLILLLRLVDIMLKANDRSGSLMVAGGIAMIGFHFFYNIAMTLGLTPIVGVPLPFLSYGGSSLLSNFAIIGIALSVNIRRFRHD